jgi:hypothetical protein
VLFEVREEGGVREVLQAGRVVRHDIGVPCKVLGSVAVAVKALVVTGDAA